MNYLYMMIDLAGFTTATLTTNDGTVIGYREIGTGPGVILVHGALQSSLSFTKLAKALSSDFTVYIPDRRGRGLSGAYGTNDNRLTEADDILALADHVSAVNVFGLSSGAIITLQAALLQSEIKKIALFEPPIPLNENTFKKLDMVYERALHQGNLGRAFTAILKGTGDTSFFSRLPTFVLAPIFNFMMKAQMKSKTENEIPLQVLVPTFYHDRIVTQGSADLIEQAKNLQADVLLLQGSKSKTFLKQPLDRLVAVLPKARRVEFEKQGHLAADNSGAPVAVARELRHFFQMA
jgi:pimeloyl-ACP methyl ester carboxylesterase